MHTHGREAGPSGELCPHCTSLGSAFPLGAIEYHLLRSVSPTERLTLLHTNAIITWADAYLTVIAVMLRGMFTSKSLIFIVPTLANVYAHQHRTAWPVSSAAHYLQGLERGDFRRWISKWVTTVETCQNYDSQTQSISIGCRRWQLTLPVSSDHFHNCLFMTRPWMTLKLCAMMNEMWSHLSCGLLPTGQVVNKGRFERGSGVWTIPPLSFIWAKFHNQHTTQSSVDTAAPCAFLYFS